MGKYVFVTLSVVFVLAISSLINPHERINELEHGMSDAKIQIDFLQEQLTQLTAAAEGSGGAVEITPGKVTDVQKEKAKATEANEGKPKAGTSTTTTPAPTPQPTASPTPQPTPNPTPEPTAASTTPKPKPATSTTPATQTDGKKSIEELELAFHKERYRQLQDAPVDDMLMWLPSNRTESRHRSYAYLLEHFDYFEVFKHTTDLPTDKKYKFLLARGDPAKMGGLCHVVKLFEKYRSDPDAKPFPHVLLFDFHEDYGGMNHAFVHQKGCRDERLFKYLDHKDTIAAFTVQTHYTDHPKVHSIALGYRFMKHSYAIHESLHAHPADEIKKNQTVMFNNNIGHAKKTRTATLKTLQKAFNHSSSPVKNTFNKHKPLTEYYGEMERSRFIASPIGLGGDCYRNYEAIFMGCIPIIEIMREKDGWRRMFHDLPVSWVTWGFKLVSPGWAEKEYRRILEGGPYNWKKTTKSWWIQHIHSLVEDI